MTGCLKIYTILVSKWLAHMQLTCWFAEIASFLRVSSTASSRSSSHFDRVTFPHKPQNNTKYEV
jgi:hypothetical protein